MWEVLSKPRAPQPDRPELRNELARWYQSPLGRQLCELEHHQLDTILPNLFGYYLLQLGCVYPEDWLSSSKIRRRAVLDVDYLPLASETLDRLYCELDALPIVTDSVDVVVLPHSLEFHSNPHELLREVDRILIPEGHVVVLGFNPWSLWMLARLMLKWRGHAPWAGRFLSPNRLKDWLSLLGFEIVYSRSYFYRPPIPEPAVLNKLKFIERMGRVCWPPFGGGYVMVARKRVYTLTPIRPRWRARRSVAGTEMARSSMRRKTLV